MNPADFMPYVVAIVLILVVVAAIYAITTQALAYHEKMVMLKHGLVPKDYQPLPGKGAAQPEQPAALPPAPWGAQQWQEGVQTSRYPGELAKDEPGTR